LAELTVEGISVRFGGVQALDLVELTVAPGEVHGLIGPNGAGKTTLFNVVTGLQAPTAGKVRLDGREITRCKPHVRSRLGLARTFQRLEVCGSLTARENVLLAAEAHSNRLPEGTTAILWADHLLDQVGISAIADEFADAVPTGLARLVELARALATSPSVLLLDEPSSGLDRAETATLGCLLAGLAASGMAVLLVEHDISLVMDVCQRLTVLDYGQIIASGDPDTVRSDLAVQIAYLGTTTGNTSVDDTDLADGPSSAPSSNPQAGGVTVEQNTEPAPVVTSGPPPSRTMIELSDVHAAYGRIAVLHGIDLQIPQGAVCALLGPNGAGKSTLLKVLSGRLAPSSGNVTVDGEPLGRMSTEKLARHGVCTIPEGRAVFPNLTVAENLRMCTYRSSSVVLATLESRTYERFPLLGKRRRQLAGTLSGGEQQMLALARALFTDPKVLLLDEISMGLAPMIVKQLYALVGELANSESLTVVLVEQFAEAALALCTQAAVIVNGCIAHAGAPGVVEAHLVDSYMGGASR
jgi:branched-chain amino acid transport system ATP-binding protein